MRKFSNHYINDFSILEKSKIGFEFEFYTDKSYYKLLEYLNRELSPIKVSGFKKYHSSFEPSENHFKIEPDLSGGLSLVELITGPLNYVNAKVILLKILKALQLYASTDDRCSLHINISFDDKKTNNVLEKLNVLKLILNIDEDKIYEYFPNRKNNFYAKSIKRLIPFKNFRYSLNDIDKIINNIEIPSTKYYGVNFINIYSGRLEYRYIGGYNYQFKTNEILDLMDYFIISTWDCIDKKLSMEDNEELEEFLYKNINFFKHFENLDSFIAEFPTIKLQVDQSNDRLFLKTYYEQFYEQLYDIISNTYNLSNIIINYDTNNQKLELVQGKIKTIFDIKNVKIIECIVNEGTFHNCQIMESEMNNCVLSSCKIYDTKTFNCKLENSSASHDSELNDSYVYNSIIDCEMKGGVFRSGKIGENGKLDDNVKTILDTKDYFGIYKQDSEEEKMYDIEKFKNVSNKDKWLIGYNTYKK